MQRAERSAECSYTKILFIPRGLSSPHALHVLLLLHPIVLPSVLPSGSTRTRVVSYDYINHTLNHIIIINTLRFDFGCLLYDKKTAAFQRRRAARRSTHDTTLLYILLRTSRMCLHQQAPDDKPPARRDNDEEGVRGQEFVCT